MLLTAAVASVLWAAPLLGGAWEAWAAASVRVLFLALAGAWAVWRLLAVGSLPYPGRGLPVWCAALALWGALVHVLSPVGGLTASGAGDVVLAGLLLVSAPLIGPAERRVIEGGLRWVCWALWALAFYQRFFLAEPTPASALVNPNVYAGWILMTLPLAAGWGDWLLVAAELWALWWTGSAGAWAVLFAVVLVTGWRRSGIYLWAGLLGSAACLGVVAAKVHGEAFAHRWIWWESAFRMVAERPLLGWGHGAFAFLLPAFREGAPGMGSLYTHMTPLELAVGWGVPGALLLLAPLARALVSGRGTARFAVAAAALHGLGDYALLVPANLWLFAWLLGSMAPQEREAVGMRAAGRLPAAAAAAAAALAAAWLTTAPWRSERLAAEAQAEVRDHQDFNRAWALLDRARAANPRSPYPHLLLAQLHEQLFQKTRDRRYLESAARHQESGARSNPYRPMSWRDLARLRAAAGDAAGAQAALDEGRRHIRTWR